MWTYSTNLRLLDAYGHGWKFRISADELHYSGLLQDSLKIQTPNISQLMGWFDEFGNFGYQFELIRRIFRLLDAFGHIWKFRISAEELSQLFYTIH